MPSLSHYYMGKKKKKKKKSVKIIQNLIKYNLFYLRYSITIWFHLQMTESTICIVRSHLGIYLDGFSIFLNSSRKTFFYVKKKKLISGTFWMNFRIFYLWSRHLLHFWFPRLLFWVLLWWLSLLFFIWIE